MSLPLQPGFHPPNSPANAANGTGHEDATMWPALHNYCGHWLISPMHQSTIQLQRYNSDSVDSSSTTSAGHRRWSGVHSHQSVDVEIGVVWGGQGSLNIIGNVTIQYSAYDFLFDFTRKAETVCLSNTVFKI